MRSSNFINFLLLGIIAVFLSSCNSTVDPANIKQITPQEYSALCLYAKQTLANFPESKIASSEKNLIYRTEPKFTVNYLDDKSGTYDLLWNIKGKSINYMGEGDLTRPAESYRRVIIIATEVTPPK